MSVRVQLVLDRPGFRFAVDTEFPGQGVSGIFGPSGSGKTTLLRAIAGLEREAQGTIRVGEETWQDGARFLPAHRRRVGLVFQEPSLFPHLRVRANLAYAERRAGRSGWAIPREKVLAVLGIESLLDRFPDQLSLGEQQRVALARVLAARPDVLLLDEPLAALDAPRKREILPLLADLQERLRIPVLHVSHSPEEILALAGEIFLLEAGKIRTSGSAASMAGRLAGEEGAGAVLLHGRRRIAGDRGEGASYYTDFGPVLLPEKEVRGREEVRLLVRLEEASLLVGETGRSSVHHVLEGRVESLEQRGGRGARVRVRLSGGVFPVPVPRAFLEGNPLSPGDPVRVQLHRLTVLPGGPGPVPGPDSRTVREWRP
jgi:molybdate transport system ATP-binding protein